MEFLMVLEWMKIEWNLNKRIGWFCGAASKLKSEVV
jgi:hypothetical protein